MKQELNRLPTALAALLFGVCGISGIVLGQETISPETRRVLASIDQAGKRLTDLTADIKQTKVTLVVNDTSTETGKLFLKRLTRRQPDEVGI